MSSLQDLSELKALVAKREKYFARLQILYDTGKSCFDLAKASKPYNNELESFTSRYLRLEDDYSIFEEICSEIERVNNKLKDDDKTQTHQVSMSYDELYFNVKAQARKMKIEERTAPASPSQTVQNPTQIIAAHSRTRLPELEIKSFDGTISAWPNFYATFMTGIHNVKSLPKVEKFMYLRSYLKSHAFSLIETLEITEDNYDIAMQILIERYQNKRLLACNYLDKIFSFRQLIDESANSYNQFLEVFSSNLSAFKALKISDPFDFAMLHVGVRALSTNARKEFEIENSESEIPVFDTLIKFVQKQIKTSELTQIKVKLNPTKSVANPFKVNNRAVSKRNPSSLLATTSSNTDYSDKISKRSCPFCQDSAHKLYACPKFKILSVSERHSYVKRNSLCFCCLSDLHRISKCKSNSKCRHCGKPHHSLLHFVNENLNLTSNENDQTLNRSYASTNVTSMCNVSNSDSHVNAVLSTAVIGIRDRKNNLIPVRAILDNGSQTSLITYDCAKKLNLPRRSNNIKLLTAASNQVTQNLGSISCIINPLGNPNMTFSSEAIVVTKISVDQPNISFSNSIREKYRLLSLADPCFDKPAPIDFLIGADLYFDILDDSYNIIKGEPAAYATKFGWVIGGRLPNCQRDAVLERSYFLTCCQSVDSAIKRFWEIEDIHQTPPANESDLATEDHFKRTHSRDDSGRYIVALPLKNTLCSTLPNTREHAKNRLLNLETRMKRNPEILLEYRKFMNNYISSEHMSLASAPSKYIIPHHCVMKETSSTTKLRVVFHASFTPQASNPSLNDILHSGPKLQRDICDVICKFRLGAIVVCADIKQMYRQVLVRPEDRYLQHIFYRTEPDGEIDEYELNVVTYGITSSAYQALRVLLQLVEDEGNAFPNASKTIIEQTFVDDICESVDTIEEALNLQKELIELLKLGGFTLHKWASNSQVVLDQVPLDLREQPLAITSENDTTLKILGLQYDSPDDSFSYSIKTNPIVMTKRSMLSEIARIFDPLGWLTPLTFLAKHLMQQTWLKGLTWDEPLPSDLEKKWRTFVTTLPSISKLRIPRYTCVIDADFVHIIGFCDASEKGYAASIYLRSESPVKIRTHLLKAKSKVSPLKILSIPRLELCGAQLLKQLVVSIKPLTEKLKNPRIILFTDSSTVLSWIRTPPYKLKTFVANRVVDILHDTTPDQWKHIRSAQNPCDCASRGLFPESLVNCQLWWNGPDFLFDPINTWKISDPHIEDQESLLENKVGTLMIAQQRSPSLVIELINNISSFIKLQFVLAVTLRFVYNIQCQKKQLVKRKGRISPKELQDALFLCVKHTQNLYFAEEFNRLNNNKSTSKKYLPLAPFLDEQGFIRVGGRLKYSRLNYNAKHPFLIPRESLLATLICDHYHRVSLHAGPRLCQSLIQQKFWIVGIRQLLRQRIFKCLKCYRFQAKPLSPIMADLPSARFQDIRAFLNVGLDYAGPYDYKESHRRKAPRFKGYIVIFVCMATKAVHLEFATSLSTQCFLAALDRFVGRRGLCQQIHSDRGTNFVGASNYFNELQKILLDPNDDISSHLSSKGIEWKFNPPSSPHMGGIWEAAVKSVKYHLDRVLGTLILTYEEMSTLLIRIEAILNSRPLGALTSDPNDGPYLTPGHFLIGSPLLSTPESDVTNIHSNYLNRYELLQQAAQSFWKQWHLEYLHTLIKRSKWAIPQPNVKKGDIVYLKTSNSSPLEWPLGTIVDVFPGRDNVVRTVKIRTRQGTYMRPVHKLVAFPPTDLN